MNRIHNCCDIDPINRVDPKFKESSPDFVRRKCQLVGGSCLWEKSRDCLCLFYRLFFSDSFCLFLERKSNEKLLGKQNARYLFLFLAFPPREDLRRCVVANLGRLNQGEEIQRKN